MTAIILRPVGIVHNNRPATGDDYWGGVVSEIRMDEDLPEECLDEIDAFSHVEVLYYFHDMDEAKIVTGARHPRNNPAWPKAGIFAQRGKFRPNRIGLTIAKVIRHDRRSLWVENLDAIDGTPVLDVKPVMREFLPDGPVRQPDWAGEIMSSYWKDHNEREKV
jgi:tRNA (adenine37-N6)-methyltransferase